MAIDAYRITDFNVNEPSFSLWYDEKLVHFLNREVQLLDSLNSDGGGLVDIPVDILSKAIEMSSELELDNDTVEQLRSDIAIGKVHWSKCVSYYFC